MLALLVAFASGTVMTAVAGARRGASALDRLLAPTLPAHIVVLPNEAGFDWDAIRALPEVEALTTFVVGVYEIEGGTEEAANFPPGDDASMQTIERPVVLEGRLADPSRADEAVVTAAFVENYGKGVGDTVTFLLLAPDQADAAWSGELVPDEEGMAVEARIVGVVRSLWYGDIVGGRGSVVPSPGLYAAYAPNLIGARPSGYLNALIRLDGGRASIPDFKAELARVTGRTDIDVWDMEAQFGKQARNVTGFEANGLLAFALAAGVAAVFLIGQSIARYATSAVADLQVVRAFGLTRGQARAAAALGPALAAIGGTALGMAAAIVASGWFPIGSAALLEPAPGVDVDLAVLAVGMIAVPALVAAGAFGSALVALRSMRPVGGSRRSSIASAVAGTGLPVPIMVGTRFALEPGRGSQAVPVRPALIGAITGVLGVLAAFTFSSGVGDAIANPERFGQVFQLQAFFGQSDVDFAEADDLLTIIADDADVVAVNDSRSAIAELSGESLAVFSFDPVDEPLDVVVTDGRLPDGVDEIALAPDSADTTGVTVGDSVRLTGTRGDQELIVTGLAFVPQGPHNNYATGAWATRAAYDALFDGFKFHTADIALRPGADPEIVAGRTGETAEVDIGPPMTPEQVAELRQIRSLPIFLAGFLALLAIGAVGHALATAVRRRRHDVAVLRALGITRGQCRAMVATQATVLAIIGVAAGVPLGVALGRAIWRSVAASTPLDYLPPVAVMALALVAPIALVAANLLATWPSHRAASIRLGHVLRAE